MAKNGPRLVDAGGAEIPPTQDEALQTQEEALSDFSEQLKEQEMLIAGMGPDEVYFMLCQGLDNIQRLLDHLNTKAKLVIDKHALKQAQVMTKKSCDFCLSQGYAKNVELRAYGRQIISLLDEMPRTKKSLRMEEEFKKKQEEKEQ